MDCRFCEIYEKKDGVIYENKLFFAQFDRFPVNPGHAEVIPKKHINSLFDLVGTEESRLLVPTLTEVKGLIEQTDLRQIYQGFIDCPLGGPLKEKSMEYCQKMLEHAEIDLKPEGYTIGINDGEAAGRTIPHLHVHIIPRYFGDVEDPVGGVRHIIPGKGNYRR